MNGSQDQLQRWLYERWKKWLPLFFCCSLLLSSWAYFTVLLIARAIWTSVDPVIINIPIVMVYHCYNGGFFHKLFYKGYRSIPGFLVIVFFEGVVMLISLIFSDHYNPFL